MGNNYANRTHAELWHSAIATSGTMRISAEVQGRLLDGKGVTRRERQLVYTNAPGANKDLADLLEALADQVHHGPHIDGDAEQQIQQPGATLRAVFGPRLVELQRNARHLIVLEAANIALRKRAEAWLHAGGPGESPHARALSSNSGLAAVLAELDALRRG